MSTNTSVSKTILNTTEGIIENTFDLILMLTLFPFSVTGKHSYYDIDQAVSEIHKLVGEELNYKTIKRAVYNLINRKYIQRPSSLPTTHQTKLKKHRTSAEITITEFGLERIRAKIPTYKEKRPWDGFVYLVSYDIPVKHNKTRALLRSYIMKTGGVMLQHSLWLNPYNPGQLLDTFMKEHKIPGTILVSKLGKDGTVGEQSLTDMIYTLYNLPAVEKMYHRFIEKYSKIDQVKNLQFSIDYLKILRNDPQIPFELLPPDFPCKKSNLLYLQLLQNYYT